MEVEIIPKTNWFEFNKKNKIILAVFLVLILIIIGSGTFLLSKRPVVKDNILSTLPTSTISLTPTILFTTEVSTPTPTPTVVKKDLLIPNDPLFKYQLNLENGTGISLHMKEAWRYEGDNEIIIADVDGGFMLGHEDLKDSLWVNIKEIPNNGKDDDRNGYIDDINGADMYSKKSIVTSSGGSNSHGTWVSGIMTASTNNGKGTAGICHKCKVMLIEGGPADGTIEGQDAIDNITKNIIDSFEYARNNGARIINCSWTIPFYSKKIQDEIDKLYNENILIVAAAGNVEESIKQYPAGMDHVIAVGGVDNNGVKSKISNSGNWVNISAPIDNIVLLNPYKGTSKFSIPLSTALERSTDAYLSDGVNEGGTSFASPQVAAVAGLLLTRTPNLTGSQLTDLLLNNATPYKQNNYLLGKGILNAQSSMEALANNKF